MQTTEELDDCSYLHPQGQGTAKMSAGCCYVRILEYEDNRTLCMQDKKTMEFHWLADNSSISLLIK